MEQHAAEIQDTAVKIRGNIVLAMHFEVLMSSLSTCRLPSLSLGHRAIETYTTS
jgi:hypothetical protein